MGGRNVVVTGGGTGIGRGIVRRFVADGDRVLIVGRRAEVLEELAAEGGDVVPIAGDLTDPRQVEEVAARIVEAAGTVDVLVANAGGSRHGPQETVAQVADHWIATMRQNVLSAVLIEHALRPHLRSPGGRAVIISSSTARHLAGNAAYGASKAALSRWVLALGDEIGGIGGTANAVAPGYVPETELSGVSLAKERVERIASAIGVRRTGRPEDIAEAVHWLASPGAGYVNGTVIETDGGRRRQD
jgi:3-oxoacyl-[acyl-carrier protein] reductase